VLQTQKITVSERLSASSLKILICACQLLPSVMSRPWITQSKTVAVN